MASVVAASCRLLVPSIGAVGPSVASSRCSWRAVGCRTAATAAGTRTAATGSRAPPDPSQVRSSDISVHKGFKIQAGLCIERPPLRVLEPDWKKRWRTFKEAWDRRTNNELSVQDDIVFMRFHFQFLQDSRAARSLTGGGAAAASLAQSGALEASDGSSGGIGDLLSQEGLNLEFPRQGRRVGRRRRVEKKVEEKVDDKDLRSSKRLAERSLFLLVRYAQGSRWTFPKADRVQGQGMRETLLRLCGRQLGPEFEPYILGACPFSHRKRKGSSHPGIEGRKVFYYRARTMPGATSEVVLDSDGPVADWAWCTREELQSKLDPGEWYCVRDGLPLDDVY